MLSAHRDTKGRAGCAEQSPAEGAHKLVELIYKVSFFGALLVLRRGFIMINNVHACWASVAYITTMQWVPLVLKPEPTTDMHSVRTQP